MTKSDLPTIDQASLSSLLTIDAMTIRLNAGWSTRPRFVHYTNAETAKHIIDGERLWLRQATTMNDYLEIQFGLRCVWEILGTQTRKHPLEHIVENIFPGLWNEIGHSFREWSRSIHLGTYLACLSEHDQSEDRNGRLSMWRAYGGDCGVAIVVKPEAIFGGSVRASVTSVPVVYGDERKLWEEYERVADYVARCSSFLHSIPRNYFADCVLEAFRLSAICTKHSGFAEEREWRIIYSPSGTDPDPFVEQSIESVRGIPQKVYKLKLTDDVDNGYKASARSILDRVIIGPTQYPMAVGEAFHDLLSRKGVENPGERVYASNIPLRRS
jgi:Protein of unknown function (DUF2971)